MTDDARAEPGTPRNLGDGLVLRRARSEDGDAVAEFHANTLLDIGETPPLERLYYWILDLMRGKHPTFTPADFTLVEETATGKIVSSMALLSQTWTYDGVAFPFGQPDVVSTDPAYRRCGLVRAQFDEIHRWSAERGELVQGITGIPWYYRQFGYEMALSLDAHRAGFPSLVPRLNDGDREPFVFRRATPSDLPFIAEMYQQAIARSVVASVRDEALWRFDIEGRSPKSGNGREFRVIEAADGPGEPVGLVIHSRKLWGAALGVRLYEVKAGVPLLAVTPSLLRYLETVGADYARRDGEEFTTLVFNLGEEHPVYETIPDKLPKIGDPYAWFIRVADLPAFVRRIAPALERRLAVSAQAGFTGDLKVNFYRSGLRLRFEEGRISADAWTPERVEAGDAAFPALTFLQLLFGFRSLDELRYAFPDCSVSTDPARALLPILFPKKPSHVWSGG
ncbi:MAG: GNAT family N-acetyltransferase [Chloroflexota bacterium]|nr:GNAT family N-acetyltransferase [Chloroflexota bacterium]